MTDKKRDVILDVDTGSDDACAIMLAAASEEINLLGIVAVNGNRPLEDTLKNTLQVAELLGINGKVPVVKGAASAICHDLLPGRTKNPKTPEIQFDSEGNEVCYHPKAFRLPEPVTKPVGKNFVTWYIETIMNNPRPVTVVSVGPLTDLALVLRAEPDIVSNIEEIVIMGGGHEQRNSTAAAEFNIWKDPEAAQIIMESGARIMLVPLDATHAASTRASEIQQYKDLGTPAGAFMAELLEVRTNAYNILQPLYEPDLCPMHDALCIAYLLEPNVLRNVIHTRVDVDISGGFADGMTIIDTRHFHNRPDNCFVALSADRDLFNDILYRRIASL